MAGEDIAKGGKEMVALAEKGMALFAAQKADEVEFDVEAATTFKDTADAKFAALEAEAAALTGKDNKKARSEKNKEAAEVKKTPEYIDAVKVIKGLVPPNGNFAKITKAAPAETKPSPADEADMKKSEDKKEDKKPKKQQESAGISKAERDELEKLKTDIVNKKKELKDSGMTGGQINKDADVAAMVARMNELKEKENPGCLAAAKEEKKEGKKKVLTSEGQKMKESLEAEIETYKLKLKTEFGYSAKEIKVDPDLLDMQKRLAELK
jgi:hypothetical protein